MTNLGSVTKGLIELWCFAQVGNACEGPQLFCGYFYTRSPCLFLPSSHRHSILCTYQCLARAGGVRAYPGAIDIFHILLSIARILGTSYLYTYSYIYCCGWRTLFHKTSKFCSIAWYCLHPPPSPPPLLGKTLIGALYNLTFKVFSAHVD